MINVLYFARLRESLGLPGEEMDIAPNTTVSDLMSQLAARGDAWQQEFSCSRQMRAAVNQALVPNSTVINDGDEVAFFPPVTGG